MPFGVAASALAEGCLPLIRADASVPARALAKASVSCRTLQMHSVDCDVVIGQLAEGAVELAVLHHLKVKSFCNCRSARVKAYS